MATASTLAGQRALGLSFVGGLLIGVGAVWPGVRETLAGIQFASQSLGMTGRLLLFAIALTLFSAAGVGLIYYLV